MERTVGFTCSTFDLLHAGHLLMLREAASVCDHLICGLQVDPTKDRPEKNKPVQSLMERYIQLQSIIYVDEIIPYSTERDLRDLLEHVPIDVRILGEDHMDKQFTGNDIKHHRIYFNKRRHRFSTSNLRKAVSDKNYRLSKWEDIQDD